MSLAEILIDALQWVAIGGLSFVFFRNRFYANKRVEVLREAFETLYLKTNRRIAEHIKSRMH